MLQAVIFDFDGVVVDSEPLHYKAFLHTAQHAGIDIQFDYERYLERYVGFDDRDGFKAILEDAGQLPSGGDNSVGDEAACADRIAELCDQKQGVFDDIVASGVTPVSGVFGLISSLPATFPTAIASGATGRDIELILQGIELTGRFPVIVSADDVARSKPAPETYELALGQLSKLYPDANLQAENCVAIEDTPAGIASARGAGLQVLGLATTTVPANLHTAQRVVDTLEGVTFETLNQWFG